MPRLVTARLRLEPITLPMLEAVLDHDRSRAEELLGAAFPDSEWPSDDLVARAFPYSREAILACPEIRLWGDSWVLDRHEPRVIGSVVFHGHPDEGGIAEVAYGIADPYRANGYAIEAVRACVDWALAEDGITAVQATTFAWHAASLGVIRNLGMTQVGTRESDTFGELLVFERRR